MSVFNTRIKAQFELDGKLRSIASILEEGFVCLDDLILRLSKTETDFNLVCSISLLKAKKFLLSIYSLSLDGLSQEAGAILRPLLGTIEKLAYFRTDDLHVQQALQNKLPSEGKIAKKIGGSFQDLRDYLSEYSSHSNFDPESLKHLINLGTSKLILNQPYIESVFRKNIEMVFSFLIYTLQEGYKCFLHTGQTDEAFLKYVHDIRNRGFNVISID